MNICIYCESEGLENLQEDETITYKGNEISVLLEFSKCSGCEREFISTEQIIRNEAIIRDAKKVADCLLTSCEIRSAREKLGLTQEQASIVFGGGKNAFSKYERAEVSQSSAMDSLIRICLDYNVVFQALVRKSGLDLGITHAIYGDNVIPYQSFIPVRKESYEPVKSEIIQEPIYSYG